MLKQAQDQQYVWLLQLLVSHGVRNVRICTTVLSLGSGQHSLLLLAEPPVVVHLLHRATHESLQLRRVTCTWAMVDRLLQVGRSASF